MMRSLIDVVVLSILISNILAQSVLPTRDEARQQYEQFKRKYRKFVNGPEDEMRFEIFRHNLLRAQIHQADDLGTAKFGVTKFSDLTKEEFDARFERIRHSKSSRNRKFSGFTKTPVNAHSMDWRTMGAVNPVEDQGDCRSSWAFSALGTLESQWFLKKHELLLMSKQQLVDCVKSGAGCSGGNPISPLISILKWGGVISELDYPYEAETKPCRMKGLPVLAYINSTVEMPIDEEIHRFYLATHGPLSVALNAKYLQFYISGILHPPTWKCTPWEISHAVLSVGYGGTDKNPFWIIKNSWGLDWGEDGYFEIYRGEGTCGIDRQALSVEIL